MPTKVIWHGSEVGQEISFTLDAIPGRTFHSELSFIDHEMIDERRIVQIRADIPNPKHLIKPNMLARATVRASLPDTDHLFVPATAVLQTGKRAIVYVRSSTEPSFEGREIVLGPRVGDQYVVASGLEAGELVVSRGAFVLDSELQLKAKPSMMNPNAGLSERPAHSAPAELAAQWSPVLRHLHRLITHPDPQPLDAITQHLKNIHSESLDAESQQLWTEFQRRLLNQLELAREEIDPSPGTAIRRVRDAIEQAGRHLGLPYQPIPAPSVDASKADALRQMIEAYLPVAKALANDDDATAQSAATALVETAHEPFRKLAENVAEARDIGARRKTFQTLSDALISHIREHATDHVGNAYVIHCPMAFDNRGADWLATSPSVRNPYYGASMYRLRLGRRDALDQPNRSVRSV